MMFDRPNMLREAQFSNQSDNDHILQICAKLSQEIYGQGRLLETQQCPFVGECATLIEMLDGMVTDNPIISEAWLLFLPVCTRHKQCVFCFQEADEPDSRGLRALRTKMVTSASKLILDVHRKTTARYDFIPPLVASSRTLSSGCVLVTAIAKKWTSANYHVQDLIRCSEVLTFFAPHWRGGHTYLETWRTVMNLCGRSPT
jgi:hypothetical protein